MRQEGPGVALPCLHLCLLHPPHSLSPPPLRRKSAQQPCRAHHHPLPPLLPRFLTPSRLQPPLRAPPHQCLIYSRQLTLAPSFSLQPRGRHPHHHLTPSNNQHSSISRLKTTSFPPTLQPPMEGHNSSMGRHQPHMTARLLPTMPKELSQLSRAHSNSRSTLATSYSRLRQARFMGRPASLRVTPVRPLPNSSKPVVWGCTRHRP
jgi:hypothetical protein